MKPKSPKGYRRRRERNNHLPKVIVGVKPLPGLFTAAAEFTAETDWLADGERSELLVPRRRGKVPERLKGAGSKTVVVFMGARGFESLYPSKRLLAGRHCRLARPGRPTGSSLRIPVFRAPGEDLHPGRSAATGVLWEVALRAPVQGF